MKHFFVIFTAFLSLCSFSQEVFFYSQVVAEEDNIPVYGAVITVNDSVITSTDDKGLFRFAANPTEVKKICISHISYKTFCLEETKLPAKITLQTDVKLLAEVVVYNKPKTTDMKDFIDKLQLVYKKTAEGNFGVSFNLKSVCINELEQPLKYEETEGEVIVQKLLTPYIFDSPLWSYCKARVIETNQKKDFEIDKHINIIDNYLFYIANHPFLKVKSYHFRMEDSQYINGKEYWVLASQSVEKIKNKGRYFTNVIGKMWIDPTTYCISKEIYSLDFENISHFEGQNFYTLVEGHNVFNKLYISMFYKRTQVAFKSVLELYIPKDRLKYKVQNIDSYANCYNTPIRYRESDWLGKEIQVSNPFYKELFILKGTDSFEEAFSKGATSQSFNSIDIRHSWTKKNFENNKGKRN